MDDSKDLGEELFGESGVVFKSPGGAGAGAGASAGGTVVPDRAAMDSSVDRMLRFDKAARRRVAAASAAEATVASPGDPSDEPDELDLALAGSRTRSRFIDSWAAERLAAKPEIRAEYVFLLEAKEWAVREGRTYRRITDECMRYVHVLKMVRDLASEFDDGEKITKESPVSKIMALQKSEKLGSVERALRGYLGVSLNEFDTDPDVLNTPSGLVCLKTGVLLDDPGDGVRKFLRSSAVGFVPGIWGVEEGAVPVGHRRAWAAWRKALSALSDEKLREFSVIMGQGITGHPTPDDTALFNTGDGNNGKSHIVAAIVEALGDADRGGYASIIKSDILIAAGRGSVDQTLIMSLHNVRLAYIDETPEKGKLDIQQFKQLVGSRHLTGRQLYSKKITFRPAHTLVINTNHFPTISDAGTGTMRRIRKLYWPVIFKPVGEPLPKTSGFNFGEDRIQYRYEDPEIFRVLATQAGQEVILAWCVHWAQEYYRRGQKLPAIGEAMKRELEAVKEDADLYGNIVRGLVCSQYEGMTEEEIQTSLDEEVAGKPSYCVAFMDLLNLVNYELAEAGAKIRFTPQTFAGWCRDSITMRELGTEKKMIAPSGRVVRDEVTMPRGIPMSRFSRTFPGFRKIRFTDEARARYAGVGGDWDI